MRVLFLYVSTNMCRDGELWFYDEGLASAVATLRERGHDAALRLVTPDATVAETRAWIDRERGRTTPLVCFVTSVHFSAYAHDVPDTFARVRELGAGASRDFRLMFAGLWATLNADALLETGTVDLVARGELDDALADVCDALDADPDRLPVGIANVWSRCGEIVDRPALRPLLDDLDERPLPARDLLPIGEHANERDGILTLVASRGCPMACEFCTHVVVRKAYGVSPSAYMRYKSIDRVFAEIHDAAKRIPNLWAVYFHDDIFFLSREWRREFLARYPREVGLEFGCNLVIGQIDETLAAELAAAGCSHVLVGVESGSARMREKILKKPLEDARIAEALAICKRHGLRVKFYALLGAPDETRADVVASLKGFARTCPDMVQVQVWLAHETSDLLALDGGRAASVTQKLYDRDTGQRATRRLRFYFHWFQRYVALYHLLQNEPHSRLRRRLVRALVTLSVRVPFAPDLLMPHDWDGRPRWPRHFRWLGRIAVASLGRFGHRLREQLGPLEDRLAADYLKPANAETPATGWAGEARLDTRRTRARRAEAPTESLQPAATVR